MELRVTATLVNQDIMGIVVHHVGRIVLLAQILLIAHLA